MSPSPMAQVYMPQPPDLLQQALAQAAGMQPQVPQPRRSQPNASSYIPQGNDGQDGPLAQALKKRLGIQQGGQGQGQQQSLGEALGGYILQSLGGLFGGGQ